MLLHFRYLPFVTFFCLQLYVFEILHGVISKIAKESGSTEGEDLVCFVLEGLAKITDLFRNINFRSRIRMCASVGKFLTKLSTINADASDGVTAYKSHAVDTGMVFGTFKHKARKVGV